MYRNGILALMILILFVTLLYFFQAVYLSTSLPKLTERRLKVVHIWNTPNPEICPNESHETHKKRWKKTINAIEDCCLSDERYAVMNKQLVSESNRYVVNIAACFPNPCTLPLNTVLVIYFSGSFSGFLRDYPPVRRVASSPFGISLPINVMYHELLPANYMMIGFDFSTDSPRYLNFGQKQDVQVIEYMYQMVRAHFPCHKIVFMADCLGVLKLMNWMVQSNECLASVCALILISPITNMDTIFKQISKYQWFNEFSHRCVLYGLKENYVPEAQYSNWFLRHTPSRFPQHVAVFIASIEHDSISTKQQIDDIAAKFSHVVQFRTSATQVGQHKIVHGKLHFVPEYKQALLDFLHQYV